MTDEVFKLGNFDDLEEMGDSSLRAERSNPNEIAARPSDVSRDIIRHPTVQAERQAKFRSPIDGQVLMEIELDQIVPNEFQPRRIFNQEKLEELAESIKIHGIIQPLVVSARSDGKFEIVVGERRFRAARLAGLPRVPVFVAPALSSQTKLELALIENVQRTDLNPIEEAKAYQRLHTEFGLKVDEIGKRVGKNYSTVSNLMRLLNLPVEVQRALVEEEITEGQARPLLTLRDREEMLAMFKIVKRDQMKVRDIESKVREIRERGIKVREMYTPDPLIESMENMLRSKLGTKVEVAKGAKGKGKITIEFYSDEELNDIVNKIA